MAWESCCEQADLAPAIAAETVLIGLERFLPRCIGRLIAPSLSAGV